MYRLMAELQLLRNKKAVVALLALGLMLEVVMEGGCGGGWRHG